MLSNLCLSGFLFKVLEKLEKQAKLALVKLARVKNGKIQSHSLYGQNYDENQQQALGLTKDPPVYLETPLQSNGLLLQL